MTKRIASMVMAILMVVSLLPLGVFAEGEECNCTAKCAEGAMNGECPVCRVEGTQLDACVGQPETPQPVPFVCNCTAKCSEGAMNGECPVCRVEGTQLDACVGQPKAPQPDPPACNCTAKCAEGAVNGECPVCGVEGAQLDACVGQPEEPQSVLPVCTCTVSCAGSAKDENCPVCLSVPSACTGRAQEPEEDDPFCDCEIKCQKDAICDTCPVCAADFRACAGEDYGISLLLNGTIENGSSVSYCQNDTTVDVHGGYYGGQGHKQTTYGNSGYQLVTSGLSGTTVSVSPSFVNEERYVKLAYTVTNKTSSAVSGVLGIYADVQIGSDDFATVSVIYNRNGTPIGLKMVEAGTDAQFNLYFAGTGGVTNTDRYWFGYYNKADDHCLDKLTESTKDAGTGERAGSYQNNLSEYVGGDSGLAVSWNVSVPAGQSKTYSCIVGVGEAAAPPEWSDTAPVALTMSAEATKENLKLNVTAKVKDAENVEDKLFYSVNGGAETQLGDPVTGDGSTEKEITGVIDLTNQPDGTYKYLFWIVNSKGATSEAVERTITITNGRVSGDVSMPTCNGNHQWEQNWTSDADNHWHACGRVWCDARKDSAAHQWKLTGIAASAQDNQYYEHFACEVCPRTKEEPHTHSYTYSASGAVITESCACGHSATAAISAPTDLCYSGSAKKATVSYSDGWQGGVLNISHSPTNPIDAGQVTASISKDNATASVVYTITKAPVSFSVTNNTYDYNGTAKNATVQQTAEQTPAIGSQFTVSYKQNDQTVTPVSVGTYEIWVSLTSDNFRFDGQPDTIREMKVGHLTIRTAAYAGTIQWPTAKPLTYGETLEDSTLTSSEQGGTFTWKQRNTIPTVSNGGYTVVFTPTDPGYQQAEKTIPIKVNPKELSFTVSDNDYTYDGTDKTATVSQTPDIDSQFTVSYQQNGQTVTPKNAGTYEIWVTLENNNFKFAGKDDTTRTMQVGTLSVNKVTLTPSVATVDSKTYDGSTATTGMLTLSGAVNNEKPQATVTFTFADKNVGKDKAVKVTITLNGTWGDNYKLSTHQLSTTASITPETLSVVNVAVKDKPFDGTTTAEFKGTPSLSGVVGQDKVTLVNGTPFFESDAVGVRTVKFTNFSLEGEDAANYILTQPDSVKAEITLSKNHLDLSGITTEEGGQIPNEVFIDGNRHEIRGNGENAYLALPEGSSLLTTYTEAITGEPGKMNKPYPDTMRVFVVVEKTDSSGRTSKTLREVTELYDLLKYAGCSIRIDGIQGIRMITSIDQSNKEQLLRQEGLAGYQLVEYGTVVSWANDNPYPTLESCLKKGVAYGVGDKGVFQDPVFGVSGGRVQYTNVLINFTMEQCNQELAMRPYIILKDADGKQITLYGGTVVRSIGYIAYQNRDVFQPGSREYQYVWQIIHGVYGNLFDGTTQEKGGNNG